MPIAAIAFDFDPLLRLADGVVVRWQTVALVAIVAAGLIATGLIARRNGLRADDLLFIAVAAVPGAVVGGRLGYVLQHLDFYAANTTAIADPGQGSLELALAVVGGTLSGMYVASLLGAPIGPWLRSAALPLLFVLGAGKLAMVLGGAGQGQPSSSPLATAYVGPGPWSTLAPDVPSQPSQAYEGVLTLVILAVLVVALWLETLQGRDGRLFGVGIAAWSLGRAAVSLTWRDEPAAIGLSVGGLIAAVVALLCMGMLVVAGRLRSSPGDPASPRHDVGWADPDARPRY